MSLQEINFDGIVGPSHNYAGLSLGNLAATKNAGETAYPRAAALQGIAKMKANMAMGLAQGFFVPLPRPNTGWLEALAADDSTDPALKAGAWSASSMWTANAATVSPAPDTADGKCHLTVANLVTMPHRSQEWPDTLAQFSWPLPIASISRSTIPCRPALATKARPTTCAWPAVMASPVSKSSSTAGRVAAFRRASTRKPAASSRASMALIPNACCSWSRPPTPSKLARFTMTWWPWRTKTCCSPTSRPLPTRQEHTRRSARAAPVRRWWKCRPTASAWKMPSPPTCSTRNCSPRPAGR